MSERDDDQCAVMAEGETIERETKLAERAHCERVLREILNARNGTAIVMRERAVSRAHGRAVEALRSSALRRKHEALLAAARDVCDEDDREDLSGDTIQALRALLGSEGT